MAKKGASAPAQNKAGPPLKQSIGKPGASDPLAVLRYEHRTLDNLFSQFKARKDHRVARRVCAHIVQHSEIEEGFYSGAEAIPELHDRIEKSLRDHRQLEELTQAISLLDDGEVLNAQMLELQEAMEQHVREEERSVFPAVMKATSKQGLRDLEAKLKTAKDKQLGNTSVQPPTRQEDMKKAS